MRNVLLLASVLGIMSAAASPVFAQYGRNDNPNMRNFYMARQQLQIMDDTPQVNDLRTNPAAAQAGGAPPNRPQPLPRAGFGTYMSGYTAGGAGQGLPEVNNGVPKLPPAGLTGQKAASGGKIKAKTAAPAAPKGPAVAKSYKPYATTPSTPTAGGSGSSTWNSSTAVSGSVLHWNKRKPGY